MTMERGGAEGVASADVDTVAVVGLTMTKGSDSVGVVSEVDAAVVVLDSATEEGGGAGDVASAG